MSYELRATSREQRATSREQRAESNEQRAESRELQEEGISLLLYNGNMLHAKAILFDLNAVMIGSVNIDNRSLLLNYEIISFVCSNAIICEIKKWMQGFIAKADTQMEKASGLRCIAENLMRILDRNSRVCCPLEYKCSSI
jgi:phosphatidylserine/phosphatidylglycerophosphate/cardiolipin synthase-like enzyme